MPRKTAGPSQRPARRASRRWRRARRARRGRRRGAAACPTGRRGGRARARSSPGSASMTASATAFGGVSRSRSSEVTARLTARPATPGEHAGQGELRPRAGPPRSSRAWCSHPHVSRIGPTRTVRVRHECGHDAHPAGRHRHRRPRLRRRPPDVAGRAPLPRRAAGARGPLRRRRRRPRRLRRALLGGGARRPRAATSAPTSPRWAGAAGVDLLAETARRVRAAGFEIGNVAVQVIGNRPRLGAAPRRGGGGALRGGRGAGERLGHHDRRAGADRPR